MAFLGADKKSRVELIGLRWKISGQPGNLWQQSWFGARALPQPSSDFLQKAESFEFLLQRFRRKQTLQFHIDSNHGNFYGISAFQTPQRVDPISHPCVIFPSESSHLTFSNSGPQVDRSPRPPTWLPVCTFLGQRSTHHIACSHQSLGKEHEASNDARSPAARGAARNLLTTFARSR